MSKGAIPTRAQSLGFRLRVLALQTERQIENWIRPPTKFRHDNLAVFDGRVELRTPLWSRSGTAEAALVLGKVQNLRIACRELDGLLVPAGETFSFWRHVGRTTRRKGYVCGREVREGCIVASTGGGICQLSNALYDLALQAGFEIVERHPHTVSIPGSAAAVGRDATVLWNHIDLRFQTDQPFKIECGLTRDELVVSLNFVGACPAITRIPTALRIVNQFAGSCETCGFEECHVHDSPNARHSREPFGCKAFLLDEVWPEFQARLASQCKQGDLVYTPLPTSKWTPQRYCWNVPAETRRRWGASAALSRAIRSRRKLQPPAARQLQLGEADRLASWYGEHLAFDASEIAVDIGLLVKLARGGWLGGRELTVWMTRFPLLLTHELLNKASTAYPDSKRLGDFRADEDRVREEWAALAEAAHIVTPHAYLAVRLRAEFGVEKVCLVDWTMPFAKPRVQIDKPYLFFPGPTADREGARAVREAAIVTGMSVSLDGRNLETASFWDGVDVLSPQEFPLEGAKAVVCPAVFKNRPHAALRALAAGVPVIGTATLGVPGIDVVPFGDVAALCEAVRRLG